MGRRATDGCRETQAAEMLINRLTPAPLESLLQRLRWANHYPEPSWLNAFLPPSTAVRESATPVQPL